MTTPSLSHLAPHEQMAITEYIAHIRQQFPSRLLAVTLFGSKARGDSDPESDIDLLIVVDAETSQFRSHLWRIASNVSLEYNVVLSARIFGRARWDEMRRLRLPLYRAIVADGIPLTPEPMPS